MDEVSPAVVDLKSSGWQKSKSGHEEISMTLSSNEKDPGPANFQESLSGAISAATVALMDDAHISTSTSPAMIVQHDEDQVTMKPEPDINSLPVEMTVDEVVPTERPCIPPGPSIQSPISVVLDSADLWSQFYQAGTEMIITKTGRRMFPSIVTSVSGLEPDCKYTISLEVNPADTHRYKFVNSRWVFAGKGESHDEGMLVFNHPESPSTGKHWTKNKVSFKKIKLSNNRNNKKGQVVALNSMHKYLPRVVVSKVISKKKSLVVHTEDLEKCSFVAVTAYQNDQVTQLKIDYNPFAKAFRDAGTDQQYGPYGSAATSAGMMSAWPPLSPLLSPYGDHTQPLMSPAGLQHSPLPQFNTAFGNFESPPFSPLPAYRQIQPQHQVLQQQMFGLSNQQARPSPIPRFNSVFNHWDTTTNPSSPLAHHPNSAFMIPPGDIIPPLTVTQPPTTLP